MVQLWRICSLFFGFFLFFAWLTPGVEPAETIFKGVHFMQITLGLVCLYCW